ncbi:MAG TPA: DUF6385 domain-containing protein [Ruminiclostridium sp.]|nr:DUF6385 domain-containing protein [Ruminiclostridium sp.]
MPGMPVFQESPSQLKSQIFVEDTSTEKLVALKVDGTGNLPISGTVNFASGSEVALAAGTDIDNVNSVTTLGTVTNDVKVISGLTPLNVSVPSSTDINSVASVSTLGTVTDDVKVISGSTPLNVSVPSSTDINSVASVSTLGTVTNDVKVVNGNSTLSVSVPSSTDINSVASVSTLGTVTNDVKVINGNSTLNVGLSAGSNLIGKVENQLVFTNVDAFGDQTVLKEKTITASSSVLASQQDISQQSSYNWFIKNTGTTSAAQNVTLVVEISPDGTNWISDTGDTITVPFNSSKMITVTNFLKYARFTITGGTSDTTVISCFQAQH